MKIITLGISIEHAPCECENLPADTLAAQVNESFDLSITQEIPDDASAFAVVPVLAQEMLRRYQNLNARKTN